MRKGFTLIELLVVVGIMLTLMGVVFKLGNIEAESRNRYQTVYRMQRLENCLSGYFAAFGCYPAVSLHGSRDIYRKCTSHGIQREDRNKNIWGWTPENYKDSSGGKKAEKEAWLQVEAACRSQPVGCSFPFPRGTNEDPAEYSDRIQRISDAKRSDAEEQKNDLDEDTYKSWSSGFDDCGVYAQSKARRFSDKQRDSVDWRNIQLFKFGVMSFLLPRYIVMMNPGIGGSSDSAPGDAGEFFKYAQWMYNNPAPCHPLTGERNYGESSAVNAWQVIVEETQKCSNSKNETQVLESFTKLANIPSQAVCARWVPYLEEICTCNHAQKLFGVNIRLSDDTALGGDSIEIYAPVSDSGEPDLSKQYVLDCITLKDGWGEDFYYYSPAPHQSYTLWSSGPNMRTFPPWISRDSDALSKNAKECISFWIEDDITSLSN